MVGAHRAGFYDLRPAQSDEALRNSAVAGPLSGLSGDEERWLGYLDTDELISTVRVR